MALTRPGQGPPPVPGGATPPTPPSWISGGTTPPDPGGPAWHFNGTGMPPMPGNLGAGVGHPSSYYTNPGAGVAGPPGAASVGYHITSSTHPAIQHIIGGGGPTNSGWPGTPGTTPPAWWPPGAPWPPPVRNWFGPPGGGGDPYGPPTQAPPGYGGGDPYGPPVQPPALPPFLERLRQLYGG